MSSRYCPDCVSEMQLEKRKLGKVEHFYVCPSCGIREQKNQEQESLIIKTKEKKELDDYYGESEQDNIIGLIQ